MTKAVFLGIQLLSPLGWVSGRKAGKSHGSPIPAGIRLESRGPWVPSMTTSSALAPRALF